MAEINTAKPGRLLYLLGKGISQAREEFGSKSGGSYDILQNSFVSFEDKEDMPPNRIAKSLKMPFESRPTALTFTTNGQYMILGMVDGFIEVWSALTKSLATDIGYQNDEVFMMHESEIVLMLSSRDSGFLAVADVSKKVNIWNIQKGTVLKSFEKSHLQSVSAMVFSPSEDQLITAATDIKVIDCNSGLGIEEW
jgi:WD40 repeat protein